MEHTYIVRHLETGDRWLEQLAPVQVCESFRLPARQIGLAEFYFYKTFVVAIRQKVTTGVASVFLLQSVGQIIGHVKHSIIVSFWGPPQRGETPQRSVLVPLSDGGRSPLAAE